MILLMSGLPLNHSTSFNFQLHLLRRGLAEKGINTALVSPSGSASGKVEQLQDFLSITYSVEEVNRVIKQTSSTAVICLGYQDQFPFLGRSGFHRVPFYLWAQYSRLPDANTVSGIHIVPLTEITRVFCMNAGVGSISSVIPHAVDTRIFYPRGMGTRQKIRERMGLSCEFVIGMVGANALRKRLDDCIAVFSLFHKSIPCSCLLIKTDRIKSSSGFDIPRLLARYGIMKYTRVVAEPYGEEEMADIYNAMDIYIHFAEWEGFGIPVIEAMACGIPVITHPIQGPSEIVPYKRIIVRKSKIIRDGATILRRVNIEEAARMLTLIYHKREILEAASIRGLKEIQARYELSTVSQMWSNLLNIY